MCLTATPVELEGEQWWNLLQRARAVPADESDRVRKAITRFQHAAAEAGLAPDVENRLEELESAALAFGEALRPYVTRRLRCEEGELRDFKNALGEPEGAGHHPHRSYEDVPVSWTKDVDPALAGEMIAFEGLAAAVRGLSLDEQIPRRLRHFRTLLASGHVSAEVLIEQLSEEKSFDAFLEWVERRSQGAETATSKGKFRRMGHWLQEIRAIAREAPVRRGGGDASSARHPRLRAAVDEVERWTDPGGGKRPEKVLVFGTVNRPLRALTHILNARHLLRALDAGIPVPVPGEVRPYVQREYCELWKAGAFTGSLRDNALGKRAVAERLKAAKTGYEKKFLVDVREHANPLIERCLATEAVTRLTGALDLGQRRKLTEGLAAAARSLVAEDLIARAQIGDDAVAFIRSHGSRRKRGRTTAEKDAAAAEIRDTTERIWRKRIEPLAGRVDEAIAATDQYADDAATAMLRWVAEEGGRHRLAHARLLAGKTGWHARLDMQSGFNLPSAFPRVLVCQSRVGREGLNLHEACRVVVLFHPEWNPAVVEQQIGRVDRLGSLWERRSKEWLEDRGHEIPRLLIRSIVFGGTYDELQWACVKDRQRELEANLFAALLPATAREKVPANWRPRLAKAAPRFSPVEKAEPTRMSKVG
jgi:hypothetical protein